MMLKGLKIIYINFRGLVNLVIALAKGKSFFNFRLYNKFEEDQVNRGVFKFNNRDRFAIVMQGPLILDFDFTVETVKTYRRNFPDAVLIISTWHISDDVKEILNNYDVFIIENEKPDNPGIYNTNLQIVTSRAGILAAKEKGAKCVLKTRTDQRIYHPGLDTYLFNLIEFFPFSAAFHGQKKRLVAISLNTHKYRLYGVSDMFLFGHIDDMLMYWDIALDKRINSPEEMKNAGRTFREFAMWRVCEVYFCTEFLKSIGRDITYTLADSFHVFREHFVIIDQASIKLYWHKYTLNEDRYAAYGFFNAELSFNDWLVLYNSLEMVTIDEHILDQSASLLN